MTPGTPPNNPSKQNTPNKTPPKQAEAWLLSTVSNLPKRTKGQLHSLGVIYHQTETSEPDRLVPLSRVALIIAHHEILFCPHDLLLNTPLDLC